MNIFMWVGLAAGFVWLGCLPWGAFPPPRVERVSNVAGGIMLTCVAVGLVHAVWVTSP